MDYVYIIKFIFIILLTIVTDIAWTYYFIKVQEKESVLAGVWATTIVLCGAFSTISYVHESSFLVAALIGSFIGTAGSVEYKKRVDQEIMGKKDDASKKEAI